MKSSKRNSVSRGPLEASGWNCAEKKGLLRWRMPFVCSVVHVDEQGFPFVGECFVVDGEAVVLRCYEATLASGEPHGLVVAAVAVFEFVCACSGGFSQQLVSHADSADRFVAFEGFADVADGGFGEVRVARAVTDEESVVGYGAEVVVPWYAYHARTPRLSRQRMMLCFMPQSTSTTVLASVAFSSPRATGSESMLS